MRRIDNSENAVQIETQPYTCSAPTFDISRNKHRFVQAQTVSEVNLKHVTARFYVESHRKAVVEIAIAVQNRYVFHVERSTSTQFIPKAHA